jgi:predicted nucleotidyltransferase
MSGSFVERGGPAILSKEKRAEIALSEGVNLVLELPFPWSMSGADRFAAGALSILEGMGGIDCLAFGSECGEIDRLREIATILKSDAFELNMKEISGTRPDLSYAMIRELAYLSVTGKELPKLPPNDLLGVAYLTHLQKIEPLVLKRLPGYSAGGARLAYAKVDMDELSQCVPDTTKSSLIQKDRGTSTVIDRAMLAHLQIISKELLASYAECTPELAADLKSASNRAQTVEELVKMATSKHYTSARVRRGLWHSYLQTPKSAPISVPHFTNLLAADAVGREYLRSVAKTRSITVVTRPSNAEVSEEVAMEYARSATADCVYAALHGISCSKKPPLIK